MAARPNNKLFIANVQRWIDASRGKVDLVLRKVLLDLSYGIVARTPVDTGRLRANWQFGVAELPSGEVGGVADPLPELQAQISVAVAGTIHYIVNNLPYAPVIEYGLYPNPPKGGEGKTAGGYSTQAPSGMVRVTLIEYKSYLEKAATDVRAMG